jgi:hypothetical protein
VKTPRRSENRAGSSNKLAILELLARKNTTNTVDFGDTQVEMVTLPFI